MPHYEYRTADGKIDTIYAHGRPVLWLASLGYAVFFAGQYSLIGFVAGDVIRAL